MCWLDFNESLIGINGSNAIIWKIALYNTVYYTNERLPLSCLEILSHWKFNRYLPLFYVGWQVTLPENDNNTIDTNRNWSYDDTTLIMLSQRFYSDFGKSQQPLTQNKIREATKIKITKYKASKPNRFKVQWNRRNIKFNINHKKYISIEQIETRASLICLYSFFILLFFFSVARTTQYFFYSRLFNVFLFPFFSFFVVWCIVISLNILKRYLRRQKQVIGIYKKIKKPKRT